MSEQEPKSGAPGASSEPGEALVERSRGFSPIWLIPIVVAVIAVSLAYRAIEERGVEVVILFESAEGLTAGKSPVKYRDIEIGSVDEIRFRDLKTVEVHCTLDQGAAKYMTEDASWWVVRPRIGGGGISGLETIVSGGYLTVEPGSKDKPESREFVGLEEPPIPNRDEAGLQLVLHTDDIGGVSAGSSVSFRNIDVGDVIHYALAEDGKSVEVQIIVRQEYAHLVTSRSRFWDAGGIDVSVGPGGIDVKTESLAAIISGGVAFDSPAGGKPAQNGDEYWLHKSWAAVHKTSTSHGGLRLVLESGALGGVAVGNPVTYREMPVGEVVSHELAKDGRKIRISVNIEPRYASLVRDNSVFWNASGITADLGLTGLHVHAESLKSLLAGGVAFATPGSPGHTVSDGSVFQLHPEAKKAWIEWETDYSPKKDDPPEKHARKGRFFHHKGKNEEEAKQDDATPEPSDDEHKHGFLRRLFHHGD